jgi:hypothetical protein
MKEHPAIDFLKLKVLSLLSNQVNDVTKKNL